MPRGNRKNPPTASLFRPIHLDERTDTPDTDASSRPSSFSISTERDSSTASIATPRSVSALGAHGRLSRTSTNASRAASSLDTNGDKLRRRHHSTSSSSGFMTYGFSTHIKADKLGHITPGVEAHGQPISVRDRDYVFQADNRRNAIRDIAERIKRDETTIIYADKINGTANKATPSIKIVITDTFSSKPIDALRETAYNAVSTMSALPHATADAAYTLYTDVLLPAASRFIKKAKQGSKDAVYEMELNRLLNTNWRRNRLSGNTLIFTAKSQVSPSEAAYRAVYDTGKHCIVLEEEILHMITHMANHKTLPATGSLTDEHTNTMHRILSKTDTPSTSMFTCITPEDSTAEENATTSQRLTTSAV